MLYTDLRELKAVLEIANGDTSEDKNLWFFVEWASALIEEFLGADFTLKARTQLYKGTNTQKIVLRNRPVYPAPAPRVWVDAGAAFGAAPDAFNDQRAELTYGSGFTVQWDQDDGSSKSALLIRLGGVWDRPRVRQQGLLTPYFADDTGSVKVTYTAGYYVDNLPAVFRAACDLLVARLRYMFPLGLELTGEGYEERNISLQPDQKDYLMGLVKPLLSSYRRFKW